MYKRLILFLAVVSMVIIWTSLAQETGDILMDTGQDMTEVDIGLFTSPWLDISWTDNPLLSGDFDPSFGSWTFTGDQEFVTWNLEPVPQFHLLLSEVYYDGTDEWIEITNIGDAPFSGTLTLEGVKSTPLSLTNVSFLPGQAKIFGDTLSQISGNRFVGKTGLSLNLIDTVPINISLIISGQKADEFLVDTYRVNFYNDKKTSFEKIGGISTRVEISRVVNALSGYIINPWVYTAIGNASINVSYPPTQFWDSFQLPIPCVSVDQRDLIKVSEIFRGDGTYPPYIELAIHDNITLDSLSISGSLLGTGIGFSRGSSGSILEKHSFLLISSTGFRQESEKLPSVRNGDFSLVSTWNRLVITIGYRQSRRVMDIVYHSGEILGSSIYFDTTTVQCAHVLDSVDDFSPGFERKFLKYISGRTGTKIQYISMSTGNQDTGVVCPNTSSTGQFSWETQESTSGFDVRNYIIRITNVEYDPEGSDTNNEKITLLATSLSGDLAPLDLNKIFRLKVNGTNKTLPWMLPMNVPTTFTKTFGFPNSTEDGQEVIVQLTYGDHIFATYTYNPNTPVADVETGTEITGQMITWIAYDFSWTLFTITYVLPNPQGKDINEEFWLLITGYAASTGIDLSQGFTLRREKTKKNLSGIVLGGQENIISWNLWLVNKAACISLFYQENELTKFCYRTPKEGEKIFWSYSGMETLSQENLDIFTKLQLKKIDNTLCIRYDGQSYLCKKIPAGKAAIKTTQEQKLYKWFSSLIKSYLMQDRKPLYYDTDIKRYFDLLAKSKKLIGKWYARVDIYGQRVPVTDIKKQFAIMEKTPLIIIAVFEGTKSLLQE